MEINDKKTHMHFNLVTSSNFGPVPNNDMQTPPLPLPLRSEQKFVAYVSVLDDFKQKKIC